MCIISPINWKKIRVLIRLWKTSGYFLEESTHKQTLNHLVCHKIQTPSINDIHRLWDNRRCVQQDFLTLTVERSLLIIPVLPHSRYPVHLTPSNTSRHTNPPSAQRRRQLAKQHIRKARCQLARLNLVGNIW